MATHTTPPDAPERAPEGAPVPEQEEEAGRRERAFYMLRHSKRWLVALILLLIAVAVAAGSLAVFTSSSANPNNTVSGGILTQDNSKDEAAILTATDMVPGQTETGTVTIENTGNVEGTFTLSDSDLTDTPGSNGGNLSQVLDLKVVDNTTGATVYDGPFNAMNTVSLPGTSEAAWQESEAHDFTFTVTFRQGGQPGSGTTGDNAYQGSRVTITYNWDAVST